MNDKATAVSSATGYLGESESENSSSLTGEFDLQNYLRILRKHKWPIALFTAAVTALAIYYAANATPIYRANSTLLIEEQGGDTIPIGELVGLDTKSQDYYQTQYELLRSRGLALRVINNMNLWNHPEFSATARAEKELGEAARAELIGEEELTGFRKWVASAKDVIASFSGQTDQQLPETNIGSSSAPAAVTIDLDNPALDVGTVGLADGNSTVTATSVNLYEDLLTDEQKFVIGGFMSRLGISPVRRTKLVRISFESPDPEFAALVANTVGEQYIESYLDAKLELTTKASEWLNVRLTELKSTLDGSEDRLVAFKQANGLVDVDNSVARLNEQELLLVTAELAQARSDFSGKEDLYREVQRLQGQPDLLQSIPSVQADSLVQLAKVEIGQAQRELDELRNRYGARHPRVVDANSQLATLSSTLDGHLNRVVGTIAKDYQLARQRVASIQAKLAVGKQEIQAIGTKKFELDELEREVQTNRDIYETFFTRMTEARSTDGLDNANARISDPAVAPVSPVRPNKKLIVMLAALAALAISMLMAFLYEQMDDTIKGTHDIEGKLGVKLLGILPLIKSGLFSRTNNLPLDPTKIPDKQGRFAEAVNTARTALSMDDGENPRKVIMVTSSVPGEGKSTTSISLGYSLAQLERVLIIDCDMRRPTLAKAAGVDKNAAGLSSLISNTAPASECIIRGAFDGSVDILPSGPVPAQPLELLSSTRFAKILAQLEKHYDRIVLDCAPTQAVSDAFVLSRLSDAVVYVVKSHDTSIELVKRGLQRLRQTDAPIAGVIISQVDIDKITAYGGDYYYQGYYDYYGYSEKGSDAKKGGKLRLSQQELHAIRTDESDVSLDIDHRLENRGEVGSRRSENNGVSSHEFDMTAHVDSVSDYLDDDIDMGLQQPAQPRRSRVAMQRTNRDRRRSNGDLDIL